MRDMKDSGIEWIGKIPANKNIVRNKYYVSYTKGKNPISLNSEGFGKPYIGASDLDTLNNTYENYTTDEYIPECTKDDILVLWDGARAGLLGTNKIGCISSTIVKLEVIPEVIYTHFFFWYLKGFEKFLSDMVTGTTIPHMNRRYIEDIQFIDFSLHQQQAIADYLDGECVRIDGIVTTQRQIIERLKEYKKSVITEAVTHGLNSTAPMKDSGIEWIGKIPAHWEVCKIKNIICLGKDGIKIGPFGSALTGKTRDIGEYRVYSQANLVADNFDFAKNYIEKSDLDLFQNYIIKPEDILLSMMGTIGKCKIMPKNKPLGIMDSHLLKIRLSSKYIPKFFAYVYDKDSSNVVISQLLYYSKGSIMDGLNSSIVKNIQIPLVPLSEQQAIADYLDRKCSEIDSIIEKRERMIELMTEYKKSLIYECVTGKKEVA